MATNTTQLRGRFFSILTRPCARSGQLPNCSLAHKIVKADPDIAGIGVVLSFVITCCISTAIVIFSYFLLSLDKTNANFIDRSFARLLRINFHLTPESRHYYSKIIESLVIGFADQQLVTALAVLITGFIKCDISVYHFNIVSDLAWLAANVHLNSILVTRGYLLERRAANILRCVGVLLIGSLLTMVNLVQGNTNWGDSEPWPMACINLSTQFDPSASMWTAFWIFILWAEYGPVIISLNPPLQRSINEMLGSITLQVQHGVITIRDRFSRSRRVLQLLICVVRLIWMIWSSRVLIAAQLIIWLVLQIDWLYADRNFGHEFLSSEETALESQWGFGQLVPMFLLLLSFLSALETWSGESFVIRHT